jgi:hypothetical protein
MTISSTGTFEEQKDIASTDADTWIFLTLEMGQLNIHHDSESSDESDFKRRGNGIFFENGHRILQPYAKLNGHHCQGL